MKLTTLITPAALAARLNEPALIIFDCRFSLADTERGRRTYAEAHIPGAIYVHLNEDLCGPIIPGATGRHPLPDVGAFARQLGEWGVGPGVQVVAYDDTGGSIAARLWWMLRWLGHEAAAVLDGGWDAWAAEGYPTSSTEERQREGRSFTPRPRPEMLADAAHVCETRKTYEERLFDSRTPERYRGEHEPIDPIAGRIPMAHNAPHADTLTPNGRFRPADELRAHFEALLEDVFPEDAVFYCGSGVTAARNLLAMLHAGLGDGKLYAGSWSEWITHSADDIIVEAKPYSPSVSVLQTLGEDLVRIRPSEWPNYPRVYHLGPEHIPELIRMALDPELNWANPEYDEVWAPLHAWRALGQLQVAEAVAPLLQLCHTLGHTDWMGSEFPTVMRMIGPVAIPEPTAYLRGKTSTESRSVAIDCLEEIGKHHPEARDACVQILADQLKLYVKQDDFFNGLLVGSLTKLKAVEAAPLMKKAFAAGAVDTMVIGDWKEVQYQLGLKERRFDYSASRASAFLRNPLTRRPKRERSEKPKLKPSPARKTKQTAKTKTKQQIAKKSRKISRKKKRKRRKRK